MGTRCIICIGDDDTNLLGMRLISDGYPSHTFVDQLTKHYNTKELATMIVENGDMACLYENYEPNPLGMHSTKHKQPNVSVVFNRDAVGALINDADPTRFSLLKYKDVERFSYCDYIYKFDTNSNKWLWSKLSKRGEPNIVFLDYFDPEEQD